MIATNGREFAAGLGISLYQLHIARGKYMIPAGPSVPPLNGQVCS